MVDRCGEAPLVSAYILCNFKLDGAVRLPQGSTKTARRLIERRASDSTAMAR